MPEAFKPIARGFVRIGPFWTLFIFSFASFAIADAVSTLLIPSFPRLAVPITLCLLLAISFELPEFSRLAAFAGIAAVLSETFLASAMAAPEWAPHAWKSAAAFCLAAGIYLHLLAPHVAKWTERHQKTKIRS